MPNLSRHPIGIPPVATAMIALALVASCNDLASPRAMSGTYVLRAVAGVPLPTRLVESPDYPVDVIADTMRLSSDGRGIEVKVVELRSPGTATPQRVRWESDFTFQVRGTRFEMHHLCPPNALCALPEEPDVGEITGTYLLIERTYSGRAPLLYGRDDR